MNPYRETAYRLDSARWVRDVLGMSPTAWQEQFLRTPRGALILALTARQVGKTTTAAWAIAHFMVFTSGSLSVIACPAQRQSAEAVRRVREALIKAGAELESDNVYALELKNGSRVLALPSSDDSVRGLTVDGWIVADRLPNDLIAALRPMQCLIFLHATPFEWLARHTHELKISIKRSRPVSLLDSYLQTRGHSTKGQVLFMRVINNTAHQNLHFHLSSTGIWRSGSLQELQRQSMST